MQDAQPALPVSTALFRGSGELRDLKRRLESLEHHLEQVFKTSSKVMNSEVIASLQEIDLIVQSAEALADFLEEISEKPELQSIQACTISAVKTIRLKDLANRLSGNAEATTKSGAPELF